MKERYLFISDLDGTLIQDNFTVSDFNKKAIKEVIDAGHVFCIATGRAWSEAKAIYDSTGIDTLAVTSNGSFVHDPTDSDFESIYSPIGKAISNKILSNEWIRENIIAFNAPSKTTVTYYNVPEELTGELQYKDLEVIKTDKCEVNDEVISIIMMADKDIDMVRFDKEFEEFQDVVSYAQWSVIHKGTSCFIEINTKKTKEFGIKILSEYYGIDQKNVITFGDQMNDYTMTKWAGKGFVMQNGHPGLKEVAYQVLEKTNMEHGVGHKMLEIIKGNN